MKRVITLMIFGLITISLFGCDSKKTHQPERSITDNSSVEQNQKSKVEKQLTEDEAIYKTIQHHNNKIESIKGFMFTETTAVNQKVSKEIDIGGRCCITTQLDQTVEIEQDGQSYIVTLKEDYNMTLNDKKMVSYWKYKVSIHEVKLMEKDESGYSVMVIK